MGVAAGSSRRAFAASLPFGSSAFGGPVLMSFIASCAVDPGADTACPSGSLTWVDSSTFSAFPELSSEDIALLMGAVLVLFALAVSVRFVIKQLVK